MRIAKGTWWAALLLAFVMPAFGEDAYSFGVVNQRSATLTAQYWNPILSYVSAKSGVPLELKMARSARDHTAMVGRGEFHFLYSNHQFMRENDKVGYQVFARPMEAAISGQIVVTHDAPYGTLQDLEGAEVVFPSPAAFAGYFVPMDALVRAGVRVKPLFAGNQEGAIAQLRTGRAAAAGVNSQVMRDYASREGIDYRALWTSEPYLNIPIAAHPSVPQEQVNAVRDAFLEMAGDPEGMQILEASAALIKQPPPVGFVAASDREYDNQRKLYRNLPPRPGTP